jgi:hypothetical protein
MSSIPSSASDARPGHGPVDCLGAYIRNPIADKGLLTPYEAVDAISLLAAMLVADERYRKTLDVRRAPHVG